MQACVSALGGRDGCTWRSTGSWMFEADLELGRAVSAAAVRERR